MNDPPYADAPPPDADARADTPSPVAYSDEEHYGDDSPEYAPESPEYSQDDSQQRDGDDIDDDDDDDRSEEEEVSQETRDVDSADEEEEPETDDGGGGTAEAQQRARQRRANRPPRDYRHLRLKSSPSLALVADPEIASTVREIGRAASWSLSTAKPGNGVDQLRDSSLDTYWQSDGLQPHHINIQFPRRQTVVAIALYMDFNLDESYTPKRMKVRVGTTFHNLEEVRTVDVREPVGWVTIPLWRKWGEDVVDSILDPGAGGEGKDDEDEVVEGANGRSRTKVPLWKRKPMRTHMVQICILSMHQNGRDTHVRQVKVFGPRDYGDGKGNVIVGQRGLYRGLPAGVGGRRGVGMAADDTGGDDNNGNGGGGENAGGGAAIMMPGGKLTIPAFQTVGVSQFSVIR